MINNKTVLAIITARCGSKRIPNKNIRDIAGKPLIAWTIEEAKKSKFIDRLILSSENENIIQIAKQWDCEVPFVRPEELSADGVSAIRPVLHAVNTLSEKYDYVVLLQPTSPLKVVKDIDGCIRECVRSYSPSCISVNKIDKRYYYMVRITNDSIKDENIKDIRRHNISEMYILNGAVYVSETICLLENRDFISEKTVTYQMPIERSIDIDDEYEFIIAECLLNRQSF